MASNKDNVAAKKAGAFKPSLRASTFDLELEHPSEGKCGWVLTMIGLDSSKVRDVTKQIAIARNERDASLNAVTLKTMNDNEHDNAVLSAAAIVDWNEEFASADPDIGPYKAETALKLMEDPEISWVREQVQACLAQRANFFRRSK